RFSRDWSSDVCSSDLAVVIKRLADALDAGDAVHAVIRGSAINNDGKRKAGFTAPSVHQQSQVISAALAAADVDKRDIGYLETHRSEERRVGKEGRSTG